MGRVARYLRQHHLAFLALFVALGGSSYAALKVGSPQIRNNSIRTQDIRNNQVNSRDVRDRSLRARDFRTGELPSGGPGQQGPQGTPGAPGTSGSVVKARPQGDADVVDPNGGGQTVYPLADTSWVQGPNETDLITGKLTVEVPSLAQCAAGPGDTPSLTAQLSIGDQIFASSVVARVSSPETITLPLPGTVAPGFLPEPGADTPRAAELRLGETLCPSADFKVTSVRLAIHGLS